MVFCGLKCSACCTFLSLWGFIMLAFLGLFFYIQCPTLSQNIPINQADFAKSNYNYTYIEQLYKQNAINCWITSVIYLLITVLCAIRFYFNIMRLADRKLIEAKEG